jgi:hypothetical protein
VPFDSRNRIHGGIAHETRPALPIEPLQVLESNSGALLCSEHGGAYPRTTLGNAVHSLCRLSGCGYDSVARGEEIPQGRMSHRRHRKWIRSDPSPLRQRICQSDDEMRRSRCCCSTREIASFSPRVVTRTLGGGKQSADPGETPTCWPSRQRARQAELPREQTRPRSRTECRRTPRRTRWCTQWRTRS